MTAAGITSVATPNASQAGDIHHASATEPAESRALIVTGDAEPRPSMRTVHPDAAFVAHLIATAEHAPQTRMLRRESPAVAQATYGRAAIKPPGNGNLVMSQIA